MTKNLLAWPAKTLIASLTPASMMLDKGHPMENRHFQPFFFFFPEIFFLPVSTVFKRLRLHIQGPHAEVCVLPAGNRLRVAAATLLTGLLN